MVGIKNTGLGISKAHRHIYMVEYKSIYTHPPRGNCAPDNTKRKKNTFPQFPSRPEAGDIE